ncbi:hypothetical protein PsorP6_001424 [Peronosclerospora sorghi]|uniref:Uncharacterized protein n=1 Tax=Peronosclerospora sorghi TaxID=230839 RepID=A0ACC0WXD3_9STRA|nr:hypothetical protein PsorP6_001424 [Peronosclerospora sorghi]
MEAKTKRFLEHFARAAFQQWTEEGSKEHFWKNEAFLHSVMEDAVAKLPHGKLKAHLVRDLKSLETQLASLLCELYAHYVKTNEQVLDEVAPEGSQVQNALLNEEVTELELAQATPDTRCRLTGVLALDMGINVEENVVEPQEEDVQQLVHLFTLIAARNYEAPLEQKHKRGLVLKRIATCVQILIEKVCLESPHWNFHDGTATKQVCELRALLERVVAEDVVLLAQTCPETCNRHLKAPWTVFYRPEESETLKKISYDNEMAKIYAILLTLAVYFPITSEEEEETSEDSSSSDSEEEEESTQKVPRQIGALDQAQLTVRQVLLAAQMRQRGQDQNDRWLVSVLSFLQNLQKPATYLNEDKQEGWDVQKRQALYDCVGQVYARAFASASQFDQAKENVSDEKRAAESRSLFEIVVCLRHAAHFMRVERKSSLPTITTAMARLAGVPFPASFLSWLEHEQTQNPTWVGEQSTQRLWKKCIGQNQMMDILLSSAEVSDDELPRIQRKYFEYLGRLADGKVENSSLQADSTSSSSAVEGAAILSTGATDLFYVDNAGGDEHVKTKKCQKKRTKKKKKLATKVPPLKRSRMSNS